MPGPCSVLRIALVSILIALPMRAVAAPSAVCDKPELRAEGRRSNPGPAFFKERMARRNAMRKWQQTARELYGLPYATWRFASERNVTCEHYKEPALNGRVSCVASARPCTRGR
jgi:hypothetical protein